MRVIDRLRWWRREESELREELETHVALETHRLVDEGLAEDAARDAATRTLGNEIGVRLALGASPGALIRQVLQEAGVVLAAGLAVGVGVGVALAGGRLFAAELFGLTPHDPLTVGIAGATLGVVALVGGYLPARRASRLDPLIGLRID
jgi:hypothetical protein